MDDTIKEEHAELLRHMLGATERYRKNQWGFRNHFVCSDGTEDHNELKEMEDMGLVKSGEQFGTCCFWATKKGAVSVGFKPYQLRNTDLAE